MASVADCYRLTGNTALEQQGVKILPCWTTERMITPRILLDSGSLSHKHDIVRLYVLTGNRSLATAP